MESITKTIVLADGEKVVFSRLDLGDLFTLADEVQGEREQIARNLGKEEGLDKYEVLNLIMEIRTRKPTVQEILNSTSSPQGSHHVLTKSLTKQGVDKAKAKEIISKLAIPDCLDISKMLVLDVQEEKAKEEKTESPLPEVQSISTPSSTVATPKPDGDVGYYGKA